MGGAASCAHSCMHDRNLTAGGIQQAHDEERPRTSPTVTQEASGLPARKSLLVPTCGGAKGMDFSHTSHSSHSSHSLGTTRLTTIRNGAVSSCWFIAATFSTSSFHCDTHSNHAQRSRRSHVQEGRGQFKPAMLESHERKWKREEGLRGSGCGKVGSGRGGRERTLRVTPSYDGLESTAKQSTTTLRQHHR